MADGEKKPVWKVVDTPLGARIRVGRPPEHLGDGVMLLLGMQNSNDPRKSEVLLSKENVDDLIIALEAHQDI